MDYEGKVVDFYFDCESSPGVIVNFGPDILRIFSYMSWMIDKCVCDISHNARCVCMYVYCSSDNAGNC